MKATYAIDWKVGTYGPSTTSVRQLFAEWQAIDWFVPPTSDATGVHSFLEHQTRAYAAMPSLFAKPTEIRAEIVRGDWADVAALRDKVCSLHAWDWRYKMLKPMARAHSKAHGWRLDDRTGPEHMPGAESLFMRIGEPAFSIWAVPMPKLDSAKLGTSDDSAGWYLSYAHSDLMAAIEWQLAEGGDTLAGNPFLPLLQCYAASFYPFVMSPTEVILFAFDR